jgi:hypothetical protein
MRFFILTITFLFSHLAFAHCPLEIQVSPTEIFCADLKWSPPSPVLIKSGTPPPLWIRSNATVQVWKKGDATHVPQVIPNFRIFPYMHMTSGHHHSASYTFVLDENTSTYEIKNLAFTEMPGYWSLRWTTDSTDSFETSQLLLIITSYTNID